MTEQLTGGQDAAAPESLVRIVVVDDISATADVLVSQMKLQGYQAHAINDPGAALEAIKADPPDLVLLDVNMPEVSGLDVLCALRAHPPTADLPVIMVTAASETTDIVRGLDLGANDYITKPPQYEVLLARVRTQLIIKQLLDQRRRDIAELRHLNSLKDRFLQIAAHDLRNPLHNITLSVDLLTGSYEESQAQVSDFYAYTRTIRDATRIMQAIVSDFLDMQAIRDGEIQLNLQRVSLNALAEMVISQYRAYAAGKQVSLRLQPDPALPVTLGDPDRLTQVLSNLISNGIKFSPPGAAVGVRTRQSEGWLLCEVADNGPGIPQDEMPLLFEAFARLSPLPTGGEKSSGLGLWIARQLVELHGGQIGARSREGTGSLFWFALPLQAG